MFYKLAKMTECLVFDSEKNVNNALQSFYIAFTSDVNRQLVYR